MIEGLEFKEIKFRWYHRLMCKLGIHDYKTRMETVGDNAEVVLEWIECWRCDRCKDGN